MSDQARIDNMLADAQKSIGTSSNLAQVCLTYTYNYEDEKFMDYVCILSVLAQVSIDSAKRVFDINLKNEIARIKSDMDIKNNKYPIFWGAIKKNFDYRKINRELKCPMNYVFDIDIPQFKPDSSTLPIEDFFVKYKMEEPKVKSRKVEELIQKYSLDLYGFNKSDDDDENDIYMLLINNFDDLISDIRSIYISKNYIGMMSWLIDRAFCITPRQKANSQYNKSTLNTNKSLLLKVLYDVNKDALLKCFAKKAQ